MTPKCVKSTAGYDESDSTKSRSQADKPRVLLAANPRLGIAEPLLAGRKREYRSIVVHKLFKLVYYVKDETVYIAALWDTRREPRTQADNLTK